MRSRGATGSSRTEPLHNGRRRKRGTTRPGRSSKGAGYARIAIRQSKRRQISMDAADADAEVRKDDPNDLPRVRCIINKQYGVGRAQSTTAAPIPKGGKTEKPLPQFVSGRGRRASEGAVFRSSVPKFYEAGRGTFSPKKHQQSRCIEAVARVSQGLIPPPFWMSNGVVSNVTV